MDCSERRIAAFLAGDLSDAEEREFDEHLLSCEPCWHAVQADRAGRLALQRLRETAPPGLEERVSLAVAIESRGERTAPRRRHQRGHAIAMPSASSFRMRLLAGAVASLVVAGIVVGLVGGSSPADPPQVASVVAMMTPGSSPPAAALASGEQLVVNRQHMAVRAYRVHGAEMIVATSSTPFPMPAASHLLSGSSPAAWMATSGTMSMYGVNRRSGEPSMFLVAAMPMAELPEIAAELHLI